MPTRWQELAILVQKNGYAGLSSVLLTQRGFFVFVPQQQFLRAANYIKSGLHLAILSDSSQNWQISTLRFHGISQKPGFKISWGRISGSQCHAQHSYSCRYVSAVKNLLENAQFVLNSSLWFTWHVLQFHGLLIKKKLLLIKMKLLLIKMKLFTQNQKQKQFWCSLVPQEPVLLFLISNFLFLSENITHLGPHTLQLQVLLSDSSSAPPVKSLPSHRIKFTVTGECSHTRPKYKHWVQLKRSTNRCGNWTTDNVSSVIVSLESSTLL